MHPIQVYGASPLGPIKAYLAGTGWTMLLGAVVLARAIPSDRDHLSTWDIAIAVIAGLWTGWLAFRAYGRFVFDAPVRWRSAVLAAATTPFAFLCGGLFGVMASATLGRLLYG